MIFPGNHLAWAVRFPSDSWSAAVVLVPLDLLVVTRDGTRDQTEERV